MKWRVTGLILALSIVIADQLSKWWIVTGYLRLNDVSLLAWLTEKASRYPFLSHDVTSFLNIVMVWNPGVSFGLLQSDKSFAAYGLTLVAVLVALGFLIWLWRVPTKTHAFAIGFIAGGAVGNIWDRLRFGAVIDFIDVHVAGYHWPAFNVADSAICIGVIILLVETFLLPARAETEKKS